MTPSQPTPERLQRLAAAIDVPEVQRFVVQDNIPAIPGTYSRLQAIVNDRFVTSAAIAEVLAYDPAISAKVLHLVNTAGFGKRRGTFSIQQAVDLLGIEMLKSLVLGASVLQVMQSLKTPGFSLEIYQANAVEIAHLARRFAPPDQVEVAFTVGLLSDLGNLVFAANCPEWIELARQAEMSGVPIHELERRELGTTHAEVGAALLAKWQLPFEVVEAVAFHHRRDTVDTAACSLNAAVHAASALYGIVRLAEPESVLDVDFLARANALPQLSSWRAVAAEQLG